MTEIKYVIEKGQSIPEDVTEVQDRDGANWKCTPRGWYCASEWEKPPSAGICYFDRSVGLSNAHAPLTVTAVREPAERNCEQCGKYVARDGGDICRFCEEYNARRFRTAVREPEPVEHCGNHNYIHEPHDALVLIEQSGVVIKKHCPGTRPEPQQAEASALLDLVRQYGDDRAEAARRVATGGLALDALSRAETLLDRVAALVPQQSDLVAQRDEARAEVERLTMSIESQIAAKESWIGATEKIKDVVTRPLCLLLNVHHNEDIVPAVETLKDALDVAKLVTPPADPSVLTLPQAPPGTVALIGAESGKRYVQSFAGGSWTDEETAQVMPLWRVLEREGSVTVVMREPRTIDAITPDMELDMALLRGVSGRVWRREAVGPGWVTEREHRCNIGDLFFTDGPLTEVLP